MRMSAPMGGGEDGGRDDRATTLCKLLKGLRDEPGGAFSAGRDRKLKFLQEEMKKGKMREMYDGGLWKKTLPAITVGPMGRAWLSTRRGR